MVGGGKGWNSRGGGAPPHWNQKTYVVSGAVLRSNKLDMSFGMRAPGGSYWEQLELLCSPNNSFRAPQGPFQILFADLGFLGIPGGAGTHRNF